MSQDPLDDDAVFGAARAWYLDGVARIMALDVSDERKQRMIADFRARAISKVFDTELAKLLEGDEEDLD